MQPRLALNLQQTSCLSCLKAGIMACINTSYSSLLVSLVHASVDPVSYIPGSGPTGSYSQFTFRF